MKNATRVLPCGTLLLLLILYMVFHLQQSLQLLLLHHSHNNDILSRTLMVENNHPTSNEYIHDPISSTSIRQNRNSEQENHPEQRNSSRSSIEDEENTEENNKADKEEPLQQPKLLHRSSHNNHSSSSSIHHHNVQQHAHAQQVQQQQQVQRAQQAQQQQPTQENKNRRNQNHMSDAAESRNRLQNIGPQQQSQHSQPLQQGATKNNIMKRRNTTTIILPHTFVRENITHNNLNKRQGITTDFQPLPSLLKSLDQIDAVMFPDHHSNKSYEEKDLEQHQQQPQEADIVLLGFIRITKTASSAMMEYLNGDPRLKAAVQLMRYEDYYRQATSETSTTATTTTTTAASKSSPKIQIDHQMPTCIFGRPRRESSNVTRVRVPRNLVGWNCPHTSYSTLILQWSMALPYLHSSSPQPSSSSTTTTSSQDTTQLTQTNQNNISTTTSISATTAIIEENEKIEETDGNIKTERRRLKPYPPLPSQHPPLPLQPNDPRQPSLPLQQRVHTHIFTIVRNPFDRHVSFFHFWRAIYPDWLSETDPAQLPALITGNLERWLNIRGSHAGKRQSATSSYMNGDQYIYLSFNVDKAIRMITAQSPNTESSSSSSSTTATAFSTQKQSIRVLALVSECFDASVLLLQELFPSIFDHDHPRSSPSESQQPSLKNPSTAAATITSSNTRKVKVKIKTNARTDPKPALLDVMPVPPPAVSAVADDNNSRDAEQQQQEPSSSPPQLHTKKAKAVITEIDARNATRFPGWVDDFRFYDAAVTQFVQLLHESRLADTHPRLVQECVSTLSRALNIKV